MKKHYLLLLGGLSAAVGLSNCQRAAFDFRTATTTAATATPVPSPAPDFAEASTTLATPVVLTPAAVQAAAALTAPAGSPAPATPPAAPAPGPAVQARPDQASVQQAAQRPMAATAPQKGSRKTVWIVVLIAVGLALLRIVLA